MTLRDSPRSLSRAERAAALIMDRDVAAVIESLRQSGAEALAIAGTLAKDNPRADVPLRILFTTRIGASVPVRAITVDGIALRPPYRVLAIGDAVQLRAGLLGPDGVARAAALEPLGMIDVQNLRRIVIPAARTPFVARFARVLPQRADDNSAVAARPAPPREIVRAAPSERAIRRGGDPGGTGPQSGVKVPVPGPTVASVEPRRARVALATAPASAALFGGRGLARYHLPGCRFGERIPTSQRALFSGPAEAVREGRLPCTVCRPELSARAH